MTYKEATREKIMALYHDQGFEKALGLAKGIFHSTACIDDVEFRQDLQGEACECILELLVLNQIATNPKARDWCYNKSVVLKNRTKLEKYFFTEIDFVLYTAETVFIFECKSYSGNKKLTGSGLLTRDNGNSCDVYRQSILHKEVISEWLRDFVIKGRVPTIQMCMFSYSNGTLVDERSRAAKIELPYLTPDNVIDYITTPGDTVWDMRAMPQVVKVFNSMSDKLRPQHLKYVKGLHGGD